VIRKFLRQFFTVPNQFTLMRLAFVPFAAGAILDQHYGKALIIFIIAGLSDLLDGLLARLLHQRTVLGQYLDPIADKLLLSTMFIVLSAVHKIPWRVTVWVFTRDVFIVIIAGVLFATVGFRDFRPTLFGKVNTGVQIATLLFVLLYDVYPTQPWLFYMRRVGLWSTIALAILSGMHYAWLMGTRVRERQSAASGGD
jgi:cardiolipin synthase (CMP-forming)